MKYLTTLGDKTYTIEINDEHHVIVDGQTFDIDLQGLAAANLFSLLLANKSYEAFVETEGDESRVIMNGYLYEFKVADERAVRLAKSAGGTVSENADFHLKAPMPGLVVAVPVIEGQAVKKGDILIILESMKMQNELKSPRDGVITRIKVKGGDSVEQNQQMVTVGVAAA
jgi:biotin carboxyl carrier protein